jgi:hypothetical protein
VKVQPAFDEHPQHSEVSVVNAAAAAGSREAAIGAVFEVTRHLDAVTVHEVLLLLASDVAWSPALGSAESVARWAEERKFILIVDSFDDPG